MEKTNLKQMLVNIFKFSNLWGSIIPMNVFGLFAVYLILSSQAPAWWWIGVLVGYFLLSIIGISIGYHRLFSHKSFETPNFVKKIILFFGLMAGQGSPIFWIGIHRGYHHRHSDKSKKDAHSPTDGFWHSYILWMFKRDSTSLWGIAPRSIIDLLKDPAMIFYHKNYIKIFLTVHIILAVLSFDIWLYFVVLPSFITLHCYCLQTSLTHYKKIGYKNYQTKDNSINVPWIFPLALGDAWHNNHHGDGRNPNFGKRWWEIDPAFWIIKFIKK